MTERLASDRKLLRYSNQQLAIGVLGGLRRAVQVLWVLQRLFVLLSITAFLTAIRVFFRGRVDTSLEVLALRAQVAVVRHDRRVVDACVRREARQVTHAD